MNGAVYRIYLNSRMNMKNTPQDWEKVFAAFRELWTPERNKDIQDCILRLEAYMNDNDRKPAPPGGR